VVVCKYTNNAMLYTLDPTVIAVVWKYCSIDRIIHGPIWKKKHKSNYYQSLSFVTSFVTHHVGIQMMAQQNTTLDTPMHNSALFMLWRRRLFLFRTKFFFSVSNQKWKWYFWNIRDLIYCLIYANCVRLVYGPVEKYWDLTVKRKRKWENSLDFPHGVSFRMPLPVGRIFISYTL
jgi:hypothetical protein